MRGCGWPPTWCTGGGFAGRPAPAGFCGTCSTAIRPATTSAGSGWPAASATSPTSSTGPTWNDSAAAAIAAIAPGPAAAARRGVRLRRATRICRRGCSFPWLGRWKGGCQSRVRRSLRWLLPLSPPARLLRSVGRWCGCMRRLWVPQTPLSSPTPMLRPWPCSTPTGSPVVLLLPRPGRRAWPPMQASGRRPPAGFAFCAPVWPSCRCRCARGMLPLSSWRRLRSTAAMAS